MEIEPTIAPWKERSWPPYWGFQVCPCRRERGCRGGSADLMPTSWPLRSEQALGSVLPSPYPPPRLSVTVSPQVSRDQGLGTNSARDQNPFRQLTNLGRCGSSKPGHWSVREPADVSSRELLPIPDPDATQAGVCTNCGGPLLNRRTKFCSDACSDEAKRITARKKYGHRHRFVCVECGSELRSGRRRK